MNNVSFIIPAYNCDKFLKEAVDSIYAGNFVQGDEVIICNDGSTDDTAKIMSLLEREYSRIKLIHHRVNRGGGAARNTAATEAVNELIFCLDSDNILKKDSISILKNNLIESKAQMAAFANIHFFRESTQRTEKVVKYTQSENIFRDYLSKINVPGGDGNYLYTKSAWHKVGGYPEYAHAMDTWGFGLRMAAEDCKSILIEDGFYYHRFGHGESYWDRCRGLPISVVALQLITPYLGKIEDRDVRYIFNNYTSWYRKIEKRPIRLKLGDNRGGVNAVLSNLLTKIKTFYQF